MQRHLDNVSRDILVRIGTTTLPAMLEARIIEIYSTFLDNEDVNAGRFVTVLDQVIDRWISKGFTFSKKNVKALQNIIWKLSDREGLDIDALPRSWQSIHNSNSCRGVMRMNVKLKNTIDKAVKFASVTHYLTLANVLFEAVPIAEGLARVTSSVINGHIYKKNERRRAAWKEYRRRKRDEELAQWQHEKRRAIESQHEYDKRRETWLNWKNSRKFYHHTSSHRSFV